MNYRVRGRRDAVYTMGSSEPGRLFSILLCLLGIGMEVTRKEVSHGFHMPSEKMDGLSCDLLCFGACSVVNWDWKER